MVREALALGLDRDDTIIRRRLQQKLEFVSDEAAGLAKPTDDELRAYLAAHPDAFRTEPQFSLTQVFLDPGQHAGSLDAEVKRMLDTLNQSGATADFARLGDRLALLDAHYEEIPQAEIARLFGKTFAEALLRQPTGQWVGPIESGYGLHLVRIDAVQPGGMPSLDEARPLVEREWLNRKRQDLSKAFYEKLRSKYAVKVQMPEAAKP
ncbi:MAG: peptidyl-prolyl cis-trans isomerase, partial [Methylococcus sp.]